MIEHINITIKRLLESRRRDEIRKELRRKRPHEHQNRPSDKKAKGYTPGIERLRSTLREITASRSKRKNLKQQTAPKTFAQRWFDFLTSHDLTAKDIADEYDISPTTVNIWATVRYRTLHGKSAKIIKDIEKRFGVVLLPDDLPGQSAIDKGL